MTFSSFGLKLTGDSGILRLMDDLGRPLESGLTAYRLGGGNPARVPEVEKMYRREMERLLAWGDAFEEAISRYDAPQGRILFLDAVVHFLRREYGWDIDCENVAVTNGSQSAFFYLFNLFSGTKPQRRTILFPLVPEYVGYADQGIEAETFVTLPARIERKGDHEFKYYIDIPLVSRYLETHDDVGAICVSRPTNPTGNVLTDTEIKTLSELAKKYDVPLMIDNAYGMPFPNIIFPDRIEGTAAPHWDTQTILSMSLSKIGLPSLRNGIIVADKPVIKAISALNSIMSLASGSLGQILSEGLIRTGELKKLADTHVRPFYRSRADIATRCVSEYFHDQKYALHRCEGSMFLWLCLENLSISTQELYSHLKKRGVVVVPGEYFFFGLESGGEEETAWKNHPHRDKCLRINYSRNEDEVREGIRILAEVAKRHSR